MVTRFFIQDGLIVKKSSNALAANQDAAGLFSLDKWFKKMLARYKTAFVDTCCVEDPTNQPVRFNTTSGHLEYFHTTNNTWTTVPNL